MPIISSWRDGLSIATMVLGIATTLAGIAACVMLTPPFRMAFYLASAATVICFFFCIATRTPLSKATFGLAPFAFFWLGVLCVLCGPRASDGNMMRMQMLHNVMHIGYGLESYNDMFQRLPTNTRGPKDELLLSWRVSILPFIDQGPFYREFNLKEPWDGPTNKPLLTKLSGLPGVYRSNYDEDHASVNTPWQCFVGAGTAFEPDGRKLNLKEDFRDGLANTILVVECNDMVPWSKPADIPFGPDVPLPALGRVYVKEMPRPFAGYLRDPGFHAVMADGSVRFLSSDISEDVLRAMIVRNDNR